MITQQEADALIDMLKNIEEQSLSFVFPIQGEYKKIDLISEDKRHHFIVDINRKGKVEIKKCTYQERYANDTILLRLDINGLYHTNPDGEKLGKTHLHIYREDYGDAWAVPIPDQFVHLDNFLQTLIDFLVYCRTQNTNLLESQEVL